MRCFVVCLAVVLAILAPNVVHAFSYSGQELHHGLKLLNEMTSGMHDSDLFDATLASGYVSGVFDALNKAVFTAPDNLQRATLTAVVLKWLEDHPVTWTHEAHMLVIIALVDAWGTDAQRADISGMRELVGAGEK